MRRADIWEEELQEKGKIPERFLSDVPASSILWLMVFVSQCFFIFNAINFILHEDTIQTLGIYQHLTKLILCPLLPEKKSCTCHPICCICSGAHLPCSGMFHMPLHSLMS